MSYPGNNPDRAGRAALFFRDPLSAASLILLVSLTTLALYHFPQTVLLSVCAAAGVMFILYRVEAALFLLVLLTPFESIGSLTFAEFKLIKMLLVVAMIAILYLDRLKGEAVELKRDPYRPIFAFLMCTSLLATLASAAPLQSALGFIAIVLYGLLYRQLGLWQIWQTHSARVLKILLMVSIPCAILALLQLFLGYGGMFGSAEQKEMEAQGLVFTFIPHIQRASSTFASINAAASFFGIVALAAFSRLMIFTASRARYGLIFVLSTLALFATFSRGAILGLIVGLIYATYTLTKARWVFVIVPAILLSIMFLYVPVDALTGYFRIGSDVAQASLSRVSAWNAAMVIVEQHPIVGIGFYEFQKASEKAEGETDTPTHPHNGFLKTLVEQGIFGGIAYLCFVFAALRMAWRTSKDFFQMDAERRWVLAAVGCASLCLFTQELFDAGLTIGSSSIAILFALLLAVQVNLYNLYLSERHPDQASAS